MQRPQKPGKRASKLFKPLHLNYEEDLLRWEYFNDHPWELARPRVVLEDDGRDAEKWDWSLPLDHSLKRPGPGEQTVKGENLGKAWDQARKTQAARPLNGEAVVKRQHHLMGRRGHTQAAAYDQARKEFYRFRHAREIEQRVAREEALSTGAFFGPGPNEIGMRLEDKMYDSWKVWAQKEITSQRQLANSAYTGNEAEENSLEDGMSAVLEEVRDVIPATRKGQQVNGPAAVHP
nr:37s ribosomal protein s25, mitochondrial [Quercus suber]